MIALHEIIGLDANTCFVAISKRVGAQLEELRRDGRPTRYNDRRNIIIAAIRDTKRIIPESVKRFLPPKPQRSGHDGLILAEFQMTTHFKNDSMDSLVVIDCRLVTGCPAKDKPYTLILMSMEQANI